MTQDAKQRRETAAGRKQILPSLLLGKISQQLYIITPWIILMAAVVTLLAVGLCLDIIWTRWIVQ